MALLAVIDSIDDAEEAVRSLYTEQSIRGRSTIDKATGKEIPGKERKAFVLDLAAIDDHPSIIALHNAHNRQKDTNARIKTEFDSYKARFNGLPDDFTVEQFEELKAASEGHDDPPQGETPEEKKKRTEAGQKAVKMLEQKIARIEGEKVTLGAAKDAKIASLQKYIDKLLIDDGLTKAMDAAQIAPKFRKAARALLRDTCRVEGDDDDRHAVAETSDAGSVELAKYVKDWAASDEGRVYVEPPKGGGGEGGEGGKRDLGKNPFAKTKELGYNLTEQGQILSKDRPRAQRLMRDAGWSEAEIAQGFANIAA